jgi:hypothetical protein
LVRGDYDGPLSISYPNPRNTHLGVGVVQAGFFVALAMAVAVFLGGGNLGVSEAAISAMIMMFTFQPSAAGLPIECFLEALIGGGTALLINALLPVNPERMVGEAVFPVFAESAAVLDSVAGALAGCDTGLAQKRAYVKAREIDARLAGLKEAVAASRETARLAPPRRRSLGHMQLYAAAADQIDLTVRDVRALARAALSVVQPGDPAPEPLPAAIRGLARATEALAAYLQTSGDPGETRRLALDAATEASTMLEEHEDLARNLGVNALVDQNHSSAVDLVGGTGMDRAAALQALQEATGRASLWLARYRRVPSGADTFPRMGTAQASGPGSYSPKAIEVESATSVVANRVGASDIARHDHLDPRAPRRAYRNPLPDSSWRTS